MKGMGVTNIEIGYIIAIGAIASAVISLFSGVITDVLGRKRTTLIFDMIAWPGAILLYLLSHNFWMFALATVVNSSVKIVSVSWNLMVVEDADSRQQIAAYNILNIITVSMGLLIPLAGIMIGTLGIINGERVLLTFALISMTIMIVGRNHFYRETQVGEQLRKEHRQNGLQGLLTKNAFHQAWSGFQEKPLLKMVVAVVILFNAYIPIGTFTSLYYAPYLTEALQLNNSAIAILGGLGPAVMFLVFMFFMPKIAETERLPVMIWGIFIQIIGLLGLIFAPCRNFYVVMFIVALFSIGYSITKPFLDSLLATATAGKERAGIYAIYNTITSALGALLGFASGYLYKLHPGLIYGLSILILLLCAALLFRYHCHCTSSRR